MYVDGNGRVQVNVQVLQLENFAEIWKSGETEAKEYVGL